MKATSSRIARLFALTAGSATLSGCYYYDTGYYAPAPVYAAPPAIYYPPVYYGPAFRFNFGWSDGWHGHRGHRGDWGWRGGNRGWRGGHRHRRGELDQKYIVPDPATPSVPGEPARPEATKLIALITNVATLKFRV